MLHLFQQLSGAVVVPLLSLITLNAGVEEQPRALPMVLPCPQHFGHCPRQSGCTQQNWGVGSSSKLGPEVLEGDIRRAGVPAAVSPQVRGGPGGVLLVGQGGGALRDHHPQAAAAAGLRAGAGAGGGALGAAPGHAPQRLQAHGRHPGLPGLHPAAHPAALHQRAREVRPCCPR